MKVARCLFVATVLALLASTPVHADSGLSTPVPVQPTVPAAPPPTVAPEPDPPPVEEPTQPTIPTVVPPAPESSPVSVSGESPTHLINPVAPTVTVPSTGSSPGANTPATPVASTQSPGAATATAPGAMPPTSDATSTTNGADSIASLGNITGDPAASAPMQLTCSKKHYPVAEPFLVAPFSGWASINSFVDHDYPDYAMDGRIVLANGLAADSSGGQESDFFPAYWSTSLRQYVNYDGHNGYDFGISYQPVLAAASGTVMYAGWNGTSEFEGYGQMILINHHNGYVTLYGHLSNLEVHKGERVTAGEQIGISGSTGHSSGPHLHFSVFHDCNVTDPYGWTGSGRDPLRSFDGETAAYLWLPGHDPLILNPPPNWPAFPAGLHLTLPALSARSRTLPPVDRLLLLTLPDPSPSSGLTAGPAVARTEAAITQEGEALAPYLDELRARHLITSYQIIPAAAAVWVRGTADAATLEALPGVASLSGVAPQDLAAAQVGLAHSVLIQLGKQQAPSLWPVGFRSALHPWRPVVTAVNGHALVAGYALPGQKVTIAIQRGGHSPAAAEAFADPETGGFVAMLHDSTGAPVTARAGDVVEIVSGGRQAAITVSSFTLHAHAHSITGRTRPLSTVPITLIPANGGAVQQVVTTSNGAGKFIARMDRPLAAGSLAVASAVDAGGDQESAAAYVPGLVVDLAGSSVTGWLTAQGPTLQVWRHGREVYASKLSPAPDGSFRVALAEKGTALALQPGDAVSIGSQWRRQRILVPRLNLTLDPGSSAIHVTGPVNSTVNVRWNRPDGGWVRALATDGSGRASATIPGPRIAVGDSATAQLLGPNGDGFITSERVRGVVVHVHSNRVGGQTVPGSAVTIKVVSQVGPPIGHMELHADPISGTFLAHLHDARGHNLRIEPGMTVQIRDRAGTVTTHVPSLALTVDTKHHRLAVDAPGNSSAGLIWKTATGSLQRSRLHLNKAGTAHAPIAPTAVKGVVSIQASGAVVFEQSILLSSLSAHSVSGGR